MIHHNPARLDGVFLFVGPVRSEREAAGREEFERFAARASPSLRRTAYLLTGDRGHAEDLLQSALWRTARRWEEIERSPDAFANRVFVNLSRPATRPGAPSASPSGIESGTVVLSEVADRVLALGLLRGIPRMWSPSSPTPRVARRG